jgi:hypothetical protein
MQPIDHSVNHEAKIRGISEEGNAGRESDSNYARNFGTRDPIYLSESFLHFGKPTRRRIVTASNFAEIISFRPTHRVSSKRGNLTDRFIAIFRKPIPELQFDTASAYLHHAITSTISPYVYSYHLALKINLVKLIPNQVDKFTFFLWRCEQPGYLIGTCFIGTRITDHPSCANRPFTDPNEPIYVSITRVMVHCTAVVIYLFICLSQKL